MTGAILWAFIAGGFYGEHKGHYQGFLYYDMEKCEEARPGVESEMTAHGYVGVRTVCVEVNGRG